jgi:hypothetical protein
MNWAFQFIIDIDPVISVNDNDIATFLSSSLVKYNNYFQICNIFSAKLERVIFQ